MAAEREADDNNHLQAERTAERNTILRHFRDGIRRLSSRRSDAGVIKENYLVVRSETVGDLPVPRVHLGVVVSEEQQRNRSSLPKRR